MKTYRMKVIETTQRVAVVDVMAGDLESAKDDAVIRAVVDEEIKGDVFADCPISREVQEIEQ